MQWLTTMGWFLQGHELTPLTSQTLILPSLLVVTTIWLNTIKCKNVNPTNTGATYRPATFDMEFHENVDATYKMMIYTENYEL